MPFFIDPFRQRQINYLLPDFRKLMTLATFCFFSAAVLAEPAVAEIEEVGSLVHEDLRLQFPDLKNVLSATIRRFHQTDRH